MDVTAKFVKLLLVVALVASASACGEYTRQGRAPVSIVVESLQAASGADPGDFGGTLQSDVETLVTSPSPCSETSPCPTIFNDIATAEMRILLKDPGAPGVAASPSALNAVTINRYRVSYRRTDGRKTEGVDVPFAIDSALTITIPSDGAATAGFQLVRSSAKLEAPLRALATSFDHISVIADVTFYGRDQAGNDVSVTASIGIDFANFGDK
jgi:hypothetical protein